MRSRLTLWCGPDARIGPPNAGLLPGNGRAAILLLLDIAVLGFCPS